MSTAQAPFTLRGHNPDVLTCIANLSNDEVFTPPELANAMLDLLAARWADANSGANIWANPDVTFLDPFTKSGVFLREITRRLAAGLHQVFPDRQERVDHILTKQVFGIGITQLTALLARRSVYCSKYANGPHSIATSFTTPDGNIWFERTEHTWTGGTEELQADPFTGNDIRVRRHRRCTYCGASEDDYSRGDELETHAYAFIHTDDIKTRIGEMFGDTMQFDVIIGNPPYQLSDGGHGASAMPIYNKFVTQAISLDPHFLCMIIPSRWLFGGRGLDQFRTQMLSSGQIQTLVDYSNSRDVFDSVDVAGGICYFLWQRDSSSDCRVINKNSRQVLSDSVRPLLEPGSHIFIRNSRVIPILRKIALIETGTTNIELPRELSFSSQVSGQKPFGLRTYFRGQGAQSADHTIQVLQSGGKGWMRRSDIPEGLDLVDLWKVFTSKSSSEHAGQSDQNGTRRVLSLSGILPPGSVCTETYTLLGAFSSKTEAVNCLSYACTKFFRFLIAARTSAQDLPRSAYSFVPAQDYQIRWTDRLLYTKYHLSPEETDLIEESIRPMQMEIES